jgi:hypothetical protein
MLIRSITLLVVLTRPSSLTRVKTLILEFGDCWQSDSRRRLFYYSLNLEPFKAQIDACNIHRKLGIPTDAFVIDRKELFQKH